MLEKLKAGREGDDRGWDVWMASPTQCTWVWASSGRWWWTGKRGVLQPMGSQRVRHDWATEQQHIMLVNWFISLHFHTFFSLFINMFLSVPGGLFLKFKNHFVKIWKITQIWVEIVYTHKLGELVVLKYYSARQKHSKSQFFSLLLWTLSKYL